MISFITVNLNNAEGLKKTLESLPFGKLEFEHVIVDGASSDRSLQVVEPYLKYNVKLISERDSGIYNAMNKGIRAAQGDYLNFMNSGDCLLDEAILDKVMSHSGEEVIFYGDRLTGPNKDLWKYPSPTRLSTIVSDGGLSHQSQFIPKRFFEECGYYDESFRIAGDWAWNVMVAFRHSKRFVHLGCAVCHFEGGGIGSVDSGHQEVVIRERREFLELNFPWVLEDMKELKEHRTQATLRSRSGILRMADAIFRLKNGG